MSPEEAKTEEENKAEEAPKAEDEVIEKELEQEDRLPFPNARVVALMKEELDKDKMIRARVKKEMNEWLGKMCRRVAREMNKSPYTVIEVIDFQRAIKKYEQLEEIDAQKKRIVSSLQNMIQSLNMLISDIERTYEVRE